MRKSSSYLVLCLFVEIELGERAKKLTKRIRRATLPLQEDVGKEVMDADVAVLCCY